MTTPSPLTLVAHQLRYDLRAFRRNRQALVSTLALPVILLVVLVSANGGETTTYDGRTVTLAQYLVPGLVAFGLIAASFLSLVVEVVAPARVRRAEAAPGDARHRRRPGRRAGR